MTDVVTFYATGTLLDAAELVKEKITDLFVERGLAYIGIIDGGDKIDISFFVGNEEVECVLTQVNPDTFQLRNVSVEAK